MSSDVPSVSSLSVGEGTSATKGVEKALKLAKDDHDPPTIFYTHTVPFGRDGVDDGAASEALESASMTECFWVQKIEATVQKQFGQGSPTERHTVQSSWERASYRVKLLPFLMKTTPWMALQRNDNSSRLIQLSGDYFTDKVSLHAILHDFLSADIEELARTQLQIVERYVAEILALQKSSLDKVHRFAVVHSEIASSNSEPCIRIVSFSFQRKGHDATSEAMLEVTKEVSEARIDVKFLRDQKEQFDKKLLDLSESIVRETTLVLINTK